MTVQISSRMFGSFGAQILPITGRPSPQKNAWPGLPSSLVILFADVQYNWEDALAARN